MTISLLSKDLIPLLQELETISGILEDINLAWWSLTADVKYYLYANP